MPYLSGYVPAEIFMEYHGVTIYHVYKDDDPDQGRRELWFDTNEDSRDDEGFYVPALEDQLSLNGQEVDERDSRTDEDIKAVIRAAIDFGLIKAQSKQGNQKPSQLKATRVS